AKQRRPGASSGGGAVASPSWSIFSACGAPPISSAATPTASLGAASNSERCSPAAPASRAAGGGGCDDGGNGRSKIESERGDAAGDHVLRAGSCGKAGALSCGACDGGLT